MHSLKQHQHVPIYKHQNVVYHKPAWCVKGWMMGLTENAHFNYL